MITIEKTGYSSDDWRQIAQVVAANWVYDIANDFTQGIVALPSLAQEQASEVWNSIEFWWHEKVGAGNPILDRNALSGHSRELLEQLGRRIRAAWFAVNPSGKATFILRAIDQLASKELGHYNVSDDPFGRAITLLLLRDEAAQEAYKREVRYAVAVFAIEHTLDNERPVTDAQRTEYLSAKAALSPADYEIVAQHQVTQLQALFKSQKFNLDQFSDGIWYMTLKADWDLPPISLWHWLKFIDAYLGVLETKQVTDLIPPEFLGRNLKGSVAKTGDALVKVLSVKH